jgi:hypothetical protein
MTPPPTGTSAVFTGVPLGAAAELDVADPVPEPDDVEDPAEVVAADDVVVEAAPPVVGGELDPPHAASAAAAAAPAPPTPAARSTVRRPTGIASTSEVDVVLAGCSDMAMSLPLMSRRSGCGLFQVPKLVAASMNWSR